MPLRLILSRRTFKHDFGFELENYEFTKFQYPLLMVFVLFIFLLKFSKFLIYKKRANIIFFYYYYS